MNLTIFKGGNRQYTAGNNLKFTDIYYKDLLTDSISSLSTIYKQNGGLNPELIDRFRRHELEHPHRKYGQHHYSLADFGLTEADIDKHTAGYRKIFNELYDRYKA